MLLQHKHSSEFECFQIYHGMQITWPGYWIYFGQTDGFINRSAPQAGIVRRPTMANYARFFWNPDVAKSEKHGTTDVIKSAVIFTIAKISLLNKSLPLSDSEWTGKPVDHASILKYEKWWCYDVIYQLFDLILVRCSDAVSTDAFWS